MTAGAWFAFSRSFGPWCPLSSSSSCKALKSTFAMLYIPALYAELVIFVLPPNSVSERQRSLQQFQDLRICKKIAFIWYARPIYAALFALDIFLDDETLTAAGCSVALTQRFLLRLCHPNCRFGLPLRFAWFSSYVIASTCCTVGLTWIMLASEGLGDAGTHARFGRRLMLATG